MSASRNAGLVAVLLERNKSTELSLVALTWTDLSVISYAIRLHDALKAACELVAPQQRRRCVFTRDTIDKRRHGGVSFPLSTFEEIS